MRYVFIINPAAGKGKLQSEIEEKIIEYFSDKDLDYKIFITQTRGDALIFSRTEAETGEDVTIFACGGDGTCFEVVNGIFGYRNAVLGVLPCGAANDFLKYFGKVEDFLNIDDQIKGNPVRVDLIKAGQYYCLNGCSAGMDAQVANDMSIFKRWPYVSGSLAYNLSIIRTLLRRLGVSLHIKIDGEDFGLFKCFFAVVANAPFYGGGYMGAPNAVPFDGKLNFTLVNKISRLRIPKFLKHYKKGDIEGLDYCKLRECETMEFSSNKKIPVNLDGEIFLLDTLKFEIEKNCLNFLLPVTVSNKILTNV